jgi:hypothetical protein
MTPRPTFVVGLALGQASEFSALAVLEIPHAAHPGVSFRQPALTLPHLRRFSPGTHYLAIAEELRDLLATSTLAGSFLVVDQTGVGWAVLNLVWDQLVNLVDTTLVPVTLSSGHVTTINEGGGLLVPKKEIIGTLQVLLQTRRLRIARELPDAQTLIKELETYRLKVTTAGSETSELWRQGVNDDLVFAAGLAAWQANRVLIARQQEQLIVQQLMISNSSR